MRAGWEIMLHVVAAILRTPHDPRMLPFAPALCSMSILYKLV